MTKRVWLNLNTGQFSKSWEKDGRFDLIDDKLLLLGRENCWKLLEYTCLNDDTFEISDWMQIFTSKEHLKHSK